MRATVLLLLFFLFAILGCNDQKGHRGVKDYRPQRNNRSDTISSGKEDPPEGRDSISYEGPIEGERIHGPANVRDEPQGDILFTLRHNVLVETTPLDDGWRMVGVTVKCTEENSDGLTLFPRKAIKSTDGKVLGRIKDTVSLMRRHEDMGTLRGYTFKGNIQPSSIPEKVLSDLIEEGVRKKDSLRPFMKDFGFEAYDAGLIEKLDQFKIDQSTLVDISPRDRITLMFDDQRLVAVVHSRDLKAEGYNTHELTRRHKMTIVKDIPKARVDSHVKKRSEYYGRVD